MKNLFENDPTIRQNADILIKEKKEYYATRLNIYKKNKLELFHLKHSEKSNPMLKVFQRKSNSGKTRKIFNKNIKNDEIKNDRHPNLFFTELINVEENTRKRAFSVSSKSFTIKHLPKSSSKQNLIVENFNKPSGNNSIENQKRSILFQQIKDDQNTGTLSKINNFFYPSIKLPSNLKSRLKNFLPKKGKLESFPKCFNINSNFAEKSIKIQRINMKKIVLGRKLVSSSLEKKKCKLIEINLTNKEILCPFNGSLKNEVINFASSSNFSPKDKVHYSSQRKNQLKKFNVFKSFNKKILISTFR